MSAAGRRMVLGTEGAGAGRGPGRWSALAPRLSPVPASAVGGSGVRAARPPRCRVRARPWGCSWLGAAWGEPGSSLPLCPSPKVARPGGRGLGVEGALQTRVPFHPTATAPSDRPPAGPQTARHFQMPQPRLKQFFVFHCQQPRVWHSCPLLQHLLPLGAGGSVWLGCPVTDRCAGWRVPGRRGCAGALAAACAGLSRPRSRVSGQCKGGF